MAVTSRHAKFQLRLGRASNAGFFDIIGGLALRVLDGFEISGFGRLPGSRFYLTGSGTVNFSGPKSHFKNCDPLILKSWPFTMISGNERAELL